MKRLLLGFTALFTACNAFAGGPIAYSSYTATNDSALIRSVTSTNTIAQTLVAVDVSSASAAAGSVLKIFNSTWTATNVSTVAIVNLNATGYYEFHDVVLKGIFYTTTGNSSGVTIIYKY